MPAGYLDDLIYFFEILIFMLKTGLLGGSTKLIQKDDEGTIESVNSE